MREAHHQPDDVGAAWDECLNAGRPAVLEVITDFEVPPLPPHIRFEQATGFAHALAGGDPSAREMITQSVKGKLAEFVNR